MLQRGNICKHGKWWVLRYRVNGKRVVDRLGLIDDQHRNSASVRTQADKILSPLNAGTAPEAVDSVSQFVEGVFLPYCDEVHKPSTAAGYRHVWALVKHDEDFCRMPVHKVGTARLHQLLKLIAAEKARSHNSQRNVRNFLSAVFKLAVNHNKIASNPVRDVITPKGLPSEPTHAYTLDEITAMLAVVEEPARTLVLTAALTGLRRSELQGLQWSDFDGKELRVERAVWNGQTVDTKNSASKGAVPLLPVLAQALELHKSGNGYNGWVFHGETGQPIRLDNFTKREIIPTLKAAGIVWHGWHSFRRGLSTNLVELGAEPKIAQAILRHADVNTTLQFYIKARTAGTTAAMEKLGKAFKKSAARRKVA
jgi:integrase